MEYHDRTTTDNEIGEYRVKNIYNLHERYSKLKLLNNI